MNLGRIERLLAANLAADDDMGMDRHDLRAVTGLSLAQISAGLQRLRRKGVAYGGRWRETAVWWPR